MATEKKSADPKTIRKWNIQILLIFALVFGVCGLIGWKIESNRQIYRRFHVKASENQIILYLVETKQIQAASGEKLSVYMLRNRLYYVMHTPDELEELTPGKEEVDVPGPPL